MAATRHYEHESDPLAEFLDEACEADPAAEILARDLFEHYKLWADRHGLTERQRLTVTMFGRKMAEQLRRSKTRAGWVYSASRDVTT